MTKVYAENDYIVIEQSGATDEAVSMVLSYIQVDKLREELTRAQMKIKDSARVTFVKEGK